MLQRPVELKTTNFEKTRRTAVHVSHSQREAPNAHADHGRGLCPTALPTAMPCPAIVRWMWRRFAIFGSNNQSFEEFGERWDPYQWDRKLFESSQAPLTQLQRHSSAPFQCVFQRIMWRAVQHPIASKNAKGTQRLAQRREYIGNLLCQPIYISLFVLFA